MQGTPQYLPAHKEGPVGLCVLDRLPQTRLRTAHLAASEPWLGIAHDPSPSPAAYPLLGAGSGDARPLTAHGAQTTAGTQPPCQGRGPAGACWCISPRCPAAAAGTVVVSGHPLQGGARALAPEPAGSWSEGLLFHHRVLTLHDLNRVPCQCSLDGSCGGRFALRRKSYPMRPHPFCAQRSKAGAYSGPQML